MEFFGTYGGHLAGFGGFLCGLAAMLYAHARVTTFARSVADIDWQVVSEISMDVAKLKKSAQKWQNNENSQVKLNQKDLTIDTYLNQPKPNLKSEKEERFKIKTKDIFVVKNKKIKSPKYRKPTFKLSSRIKSMFKKENLNY